MRRNITWWGYWSLITVACASAALGCSSGDPPGTERAARGTHALTGDWHAHALSDAGPVEADQGVLQDGSTFTVTGYGARGVSAPGDMPGCVPGDSGNPDHLRFVYQEVEGDVEVIVRVASVEAPAGKDMGQLGVMIRPSVSLDGLAVRAPMGAGVFQVGGALGGTSACEAGVEEGEDCEEVGETCYDSESSLCTCADTEEWECDGLAHQLFPTWRNDFCYGTQGAARTADLVGKWIRLQRVGQDFSVTWRDDGELLWRPFLPLNGGEFQSENALIGFFVANLEADGDEDVVVTFDNVQVTEHPEQLEDEWLDWRTTWIGNTSDQMSTGEVSHDATSFWVHPGSATELPFAYKHTAFLEGGRNVQILDYDSGAIVRTQGTLGTIGRFTLQGAITGDLQPSPSAQPTQGEQYVYVAVSSDWGGVGPACIERRLPETLELPCYQTDENDQCVAGEEPCDCQPDTCAKVEGVWDCPDGGCQCPAGAQGEGCECTPQSCDWDLSYRRLTAIGGMAAVTHGGENRLYVTQPDRDGNPSTVDPSIVELHPDQKPDSPNWLMEINDEWELETPRPAAVAGGLGRLWVVHAATDYFDETYGILLNINNYDLKYPASIRCYKTADGSDCGQISACTDTNQDGSITGAEGDNCVVNPTGVAFRHGGTLAASELYVADNGRHQQNVRIFKNLNTSAPQEDLQNGPIGIRGGVYAGPSKGLLHHSDESNGGWARFYNPIGVGVDYQGSVYVASSGIPGADIRKFSRSGTPATWSFAWQRPTQGLMGASIGSEMIDFDPGTDGHDAYSFNKRFSFDPDSNRPETATQAATPIAPGSEWSFRALTWDPLSGERDKDGRLSRVLGNPVIRRFNGERYMFTLGQEWSPGEYQSSQYPSLQPFDASNTQAVGIYHFEGDGQSGSEIAKLVGAISVFDVDVDPMPRCDDDCDCQNDGNRAARVQLTLWVDANGDGQRQAGEAQSTPSIEDHIDPECPVPTNGCPLVTKCFDANGKEQCDTAAHHCAMDSQTDALCRAQYDCAPAWPSCTPYTGTCAPPDPCAGENPAPYCPAPTGSAITGFDVDSDLNVWIALGGQIWRFDRQGFEDDVIPTYDLEHAEGKREIVPIPSAGCTDPPGTIGDAASVRFLPSASDAQGTLYVLGGGRITAIDGFGTSPCVRYSVAVPPSAPWQPSDPEGCGGAQAFDVAGNKVFVSNRCGPVEVFEESDGSLVTMLFAGPELNGWQVNQDTVMGLRAFQRSTGEYLIATTESYYRAHNFIYRWVPPSP